MNLLLLLALWPQPCLDPATCWLTWDAVPGATYYEIAHDEPDAAWPDPTVVCASIHEIRGTRGTSPPRTRFWPRPGQCLGDWSLSVRACNAFGCGPWSNPVEWQTVPFRCFTSSGEIPCAP